MPLEVVRLVSEGLNKQGKAIKSSRILILGATFKEDVRDARNSKVEDIIIELERLGAEVLLNDPLFDEVKFEHITKKTVLLESINNVDAVIIAVAHKDYAKLTLQKIKSWMKQPVIVDVKGMLGKDKEVYRL
jgi:UDP-N-acetyl-D-mannosaminuronate dehydrogenase